MCSHSSSNTYVQTLRSYSPPLLHLVLIRTVLHKGQDNENKHTQRDTDGSQNVVSRLELDWRFASWAEKFNPWLKPFMDTVEYVEPNLPTSARDGEPPALESRPRAILTPCVRRLQASPRAAAERDTRTHLRTGETPTGGPAHT